MLVVRSRHFVDEELGTARDQQTTVREHRVATAEDVARRRPRIRDVSRGALVEAGVVGGAAVVLALIVFVAAEAEDLAGWQ
jgi:hypothetical protein